MTNEYHEAGIAAFGAKDYKNAFALFLKGAEEGD